MSIRVAPLAYIAGRLLHNKGETVLRLPGNVLFFSAAVLVLAWVSCAERQGNRERSEQQLKAKNWWQKKRRRKPVEGAYGQVFY